MMNCPACKQELTPHAITGVNVHACEDGCGGLWTASAQIKKLADRNAGTGESLLKVKRAEGVRVFRNIEHVCPKCETTLLYRHFFSKAHEMEIDQCSKCGGYWVDVGVLAHAFQEHVSDEEQADQVKSFLNMLYQEKVRGMVSNHETIECARDIVQLFRFLIPEKLQTISPPC